MDKNIEAFLVHISSLKLKITIYTVRKAQMALLLAKEITVRTKCLDFADVFLQESANMLSEQIRANKYAIKLEKVKQSLYRPICSPKLFELKTFKTYIKINLANGLIRASKLSANALVLFIHKSDGSFCLCIDDWKLNNLTIKNWYLLLLIGKSLNRLSQVKQFTQPDLTSAYYWIRIKEGDKWKIAFRTQYKHFKY